MNMPIFWIVPVSAVLALAFAWHFFRFMMGHSEGNESMIAIAGHVRRGAMAYLKQQYKIVGLFFAVVMVLFCILSYGLDMGNKWVPFAFISGGFFSALAGFLGMKTATYA